MFGNRGVYHDGWFAGTVHLKPWADSVEAPLADDEWELYHVAEDFSMATDLAGKKPEKLAELQQVFLDEAVEYNVLPIDDRRTELFDPNLAGRPDLMFGRTSLTLYEGMGALLENDFINIKNSSFEIVADVVTGGATSSGVIVQQGGRFGGWSLYLQDGKPVFAYNYLGLDVSKVASPQSLPAGEVTVGVDFY